MLLTFIKQVIVDHKQWLQKKKMSPRRLFKKHMKTIIQREITLNLLLLLDVNLLSPFLVILYLYV